MSFESIIGQPLAVELCKHWLAKETTNPLLFYGPEGVGKRLLAVEVAKSLNCTPSPYPLPKGEGKTGLLPMGEGGHRPDEGSCGVCLSCKKIAAGHHADVRVVDLAWQAALREEPIEKQLNVRIETVLQERHRLLQSAVEGRWKVLILDDVHRLTADAANVLLKLLEEPPPQTAIFLITPFRDRLFATIVSRCQPVRFRPLADEEMKACLQGMEQPMAVIELAQGSPGKALHMSRLDKVESLQEAEALWEGLSTLSPSQVLARADVRGKAAKPARAEIEDRIHSLLMPAVRELRAGQTGASQKIRLLEGALQQLRQNVQPALVYENVLLQLRK
jgi:DNA polymerase III subunit delta'